VYLSTHYVHYKHTDNNTKQITKNAIQLLHWGAAILSTFSQNESVIPPARKFSKPPPRSISAWPGKGLKMLPYFKFLQQQRNTVSRGTCCPLPTGWRTVSFCKGRNTQVFQTTNNSFQAKSQKTWQRSTLRNLVSTPPLEYTHNILTSFYINNFVYASLEKGTGKGGSREKSCCNRATALTCPDT
jgi:hypothetical protein